MKLIENFTVVMAPRLSISSLVLKKMVHIVTRVKLSLMVLRYDDKSLSVMGSVHTIHVARYQGLGHDCPRCLSHDSPLRQWFPKWALPSPGGR